VTRKTMIDRSHALPIKQQARELGISRGSVYYLSRPTSPTDLAIVRRLDQLHMDFPFAGSRMLRDLLAAEGVKVGRLHVSTLMKKMAIEAIYRRPNTKPAPGHKIYPYLLRKLAVSRPNQVWATDITYIPMARGFVYLIAIVDWFSRRVLSWRLSITLETDFCIEALEEALARFGAPEIFNTDQARADSTDRCNTSIEEVVMSIRKRRSDRCGRPPLRSPGRPPVATRSELQMFWTFIATGMSSEVAALKAGVSQPVGTRWFREAGGMPPAMFRPAAKPLSCRYLSLAEREDIALLLVQGHSLREIGRRLDRSASTPSLPWRPPSMPALARRLAGRPPPRRLTTASHRSTNAPLRRPVESAQFTSMAFTSVLHREKIAISMDGRGAWRDNVFVERLWRSVKYEEVYLRAYGSVSDARASLVRYLTFYNGRRPHSSLDRKTPDHVYFNQLLLAAA
jgi:transposase InsO family protein